MTTCPDCQQTWADDGTLGEMVPNWCSACLRRVSGLHAADNFCSLPEDLVKADIAAVEKAVLADMIRPAPKPAFLLAYGSINFGFTETKTGRFRSGISNYGSLPMHEYRGRMQCKVRIGIPLEKRGSHWRMAYRNVGDTFSHASGGLCASFLGIDKRPFASRGAALKWARRFWPTARVELVSYGLEVTIYQPDFHLIRAVNDRVDRQRGKLSNFAAIYGRPSRHDDHADVVMGALAMLRNTPPKLPAIIMTNPG